MDKGAIADGHSATIIEETATVPKRRRPIDNRETLEREGLTATHLEDPLTVLPIEGDLLPVVV